MDAGQTADTVYILAIVAGGLGGVLGGVLGSWIGAHLFAWQTRRRVAPPRS